MIYNLAKYLYDSVLYLITILDKESIKILNRYGGYEDIDQETEELVVNK